ncbi:Pth11-like integral membrane protein [Pleurostoma richardsiae]|uniref:Pth11-like integral membrane protein n=1 Tax=Pleurostoma richardsiae TaxID=41990 RepID=A0AA38VKI5_9PEZI|nr:Pth11-like integral membrane protein [Pleurostoma richardsiae]
MDPFIVAIFGPPPAGLDLSENTASQDKGAVISMFILAAIFVALRFAARIVQRSTPHWDDWVIVLALVFVGGTSGMGIAGGVYGAGRHVWAITLADLEEVFKILFAYTFLYAASCATTKISILLFYQRIFTTQDKFFRMLVAFGYFLSFSYPVVIWVTMGTACKPVSHFWTQFGGTAGTCIDTNKFFLALGIVNMITDFYILLIPIPQILKLQMSTKKKLGVTGIMMLGSFVCSASAVRIYYLTRLIDSIDVTSAMGPLFIWSDLEPSIAIVSACLPHLAPLRHIVHSKISSTFRSNGGSGPTSGSVPWRDGGASSAKGPMFTYGGSRYFGGDKLKLVDADDEIGLTNRVTAGSVLGKTSSTGSNSAENVNSHSIVVQSSFVQTTSTRPE